MLRFNSIAVTLFLAAGVALANEGGDYGHPIPERSIQSCSLLVADIGLAAMEQGDAHVLRGGANIILGDFDQPVSGLGGAIQLSPHNPEAFTTRANAYLRKAAYASAQLTLPEWFEPAARWRSSKPRLNTTRLDAAIARYAREYRMLYGPGHYREFAVAPPKTFADVVAAVDSALATSSREATKREIPGALDDERELRWISRDNRAIVMVHLSRVDPSRSDGPAFILLFEPK